MNSSNEDVIKLIDRAEQIYHDAMEIRKPNVLQVDLSRGFESSENACKQETSVYMSPIMKNMIEQIDHKTGEWKLTITDEPTKAEQWLNLRVREMLAKQSGSSSDYDIKKPIDSIDHYSVDCVRNWSDNIRQIQPGQFEQRLKTSHEFGKPMDPGPIFKIMREDKIMQLAIRRLVRLVPHVRADVDFTETSAPFETKHTNVGYKWWFNDKVLTPEGETYGKVALHTAEKLTPSQLYDWNVCTAFGRNQRGKGRLLIAMSRVANLWFNRLEANEISKRKDVPFYIGYRDENDLKKAMIQFAEFAIKYDLLVFNWDQHGFDWHINPAFLALVGAIRESAADNALGKRIAYMRAMFGIHSWLVNGMTGKLEEIFGRMFSGFIDTNAGDTEVEGTIFPWALMVMDPQWSKFADMCLYYMFGMGDDFLSFIRRQYYDPDKLSHLMESIGFELNTEKDAYGVFFLQYRLFRLNSEWVMVYPWTRVLRSMCFLERSRGLGPYGWLVSQYQQLNKLVEYPPALDNVIRLLLPFDKLKFGVDLSVSDIINGIKSEDQSAKEEAKGSQYRSTAEKLFDGDPTKQKQFSEDGSLNSSWLESVHDAVAASVRRVQAEKISPQWY